MSERIYHTERVSEDSSWTTSGNLTAEEASLERDRQTQALPKHSRTWIEIKRG